MYVVKYYILGRSGETAQKTFKGYVEAVKFQELIGKSYISTTKK